MILAFYMTDGSVGTIFSKFKESFGSHKITIQRDRSDLISLANTDQFVGIESETFEINSRSSIPIWFVIIQIVASWVCYVVAKFACKICIQGFSFAFPISLTVPVAISALIAFCGVHFDNKCKISDFLIPKYLFWYCNEEPFIRDEPFFNIHAIMWLLWLLSQTWIAIHIWAPKCERLATTEKLFVNPMYCGVIIDQSIAFNRRRDDEEEIKSEDINLETEGNTLQDPSQHYETISENMDDKKKSSTFSSDQIIRIYACATMWHETAQEMIAMLKSVMRMDEDQSARRNAQKYLRIVDPDYYEFEVHIFFDDAFELCDENDDDMIVNRFVKQLIEVIDTSASNVHQCNIKLKLPTKVPTPYGGRLEWRMPGQNKLIAHLKDKSKIRHRKRWSQVMYMYYLLGHRLMELPIDVNRKAVMAENTYLLTLDGDINFRPHAVQLLVDLMKKNRNLGAACGRIHPVGSGFMTWYQKFEYAIGHWLQKATEHMIGCVLCSPGCFSLFRAKALMDDNVMRRYTTRSDEALHYVQYDQGEDRWLCTLLLQRGPGTIFLMLVGALVAAFRISNWDSFYYNIVPILFFIIICFVTKNDVQIFVAQILSAAYCLLMMAVFVGQAIQMTEDGIGSPSAIFFISLTGSFIVAGLLHPQEMACLAPLLLYFLSIPCMYLLLIIYSLVNLNVVTWGTREVQTKKTKKELEEEKKATEEHKKKNLLGFLNMGDNRKEEGSITFNLANLFKCMFCTYPKPNEEAIHLIKIQDQLDSITQKLSSLEKGIDPNAQSKRTSIGRTARFSDNLSTVTENEDEEEFGSETSDINIDDKESEGKHDRDDLLNPYWIEDRDLKNGEVAYLHPSEIQFWKDLIGKYLYPIEQNKEHQERVANDLKELRNRVVFAFFMLNALFVLVVFLLQLNKEILHIDWPLGVRENITINPDTNEYIVDKEYLELEPIGLVFVVFFGTILVIQFVGMLFHRFGTLSHILASVELTFCSPKVEDVSEDDFIDKNAIQIARQLQRLRGIDEDDKSDDSKYGNRVEKRKTIFNLEKRLQQHRRIGTLDVAFRKRFLNLSNNMPTGTPILGGIRNKEQIMALERRRNTVIAGESHSRPGMQTLGAKNEFVRNQANRSTLDSKRPRNGVDINGGLHNRAYIQDSDDDDDPIDRPINLNIYSPGSRHSANSSVSKRQSLSHNL
ncbi:unnamed protein product [Medioppia subpectinata]|uniref:chitin synthase n=1 Tax=Medioppia subpectinata TaxID=1979941 RepID=A0A7R9L040_9ACAR|nr:unnamed protein product [Medioppia subpectinata]CAG2111939.1 unnamed protein product [Medioppia subpectinata]